MCVFGGCFCFGGFFGLGLFFFFFGAFWLGFFLFLFFFFSLPGQWGEEQKSD